MNTRANLLNYDQTALEAFFRDLGEKPYRATQFMRWVYQSHLSDFSLMTNFSKALREQLTQMACVRVPEIVQHQTSRDGTQKWLLRLDDGNQIETVFIPEEGRGTLCVSSQVGCALNCQFCATARQGFSRNLTVAEIIGQVWLAARELQHSLMDRKITNVVMMGMGEPLLNYDAVVSAMSIMLNDHAYGLSKRRVTLSTSGVLPALQQLKQDSPVALAVSLHAPNDPLRDILVPINKKYPIAQLMAVCRDYFPTESRRKITFEYVMLHEMNDYPEHARQLISLLRDIPAKLNLIPFNSIPGSDYRCSSSKRIDQFQKILLNAGINTIIRKTRGSDIDGACGQLVGNVMDKTSRSRRFKEVPIAVVNQVNGKQVLGNVL